MLTHRGNLDYTVTSWLCRSSCNPVDLALSAVGCCTSSAAWFAGSCTPLRPRTRLDSGTHSTTLQHHSTRTLLPRRRPGHFLHPLRCSRGRPPPSNLLCCWQNLNARITVRATDVVLYYGIVRSVALIISFHIPLLLHWRVEVDR